MNIETAIDRDHRVDFDLESAAAERSRKRSWLIVGSIVAIAALALAWYLMRGSKTPAAGTAATAAPAGRKGARQATSVTVIVPGRATIEGAITATGTLAARRELPVGIPGEGGQIARVLVEPGQWVRQGQVLATIDRRVQAEQANALSAQIGVADSDARLAQGELDRALALVGRGFISKADVDRKRAARDAAAARARVARAQLATTQAANSRLDVRAPEGGLVLTRAVEPGQVVSAGSGVLFRIARGGEMEIKALVGESDLARLSVGARAEVTPVGATQSVPGRVWQISPVIDPQTRQGTARIAVPYDRAIRPGGFATARIASGTVVAPLLPESSVQTDQKGRYVLVVDDAGKTARRDIKTGTVTNAGVPVIEGLTGTERVVLSAGAFITPGETIKPVLQTQGR